jgi:hypothetical protein
MDHVCLRPEKRAADHRDVRANIPTDISSMGLLGFLSFCRLRSFTSHNHLRLSGIMQLSSIVMTSIPASKVLDHLLLLGAQF